MGIPYNIGVACNNAAVVKFIFALHDQIFISFIPAADLEV